MARDYDALLRSDAVAFMPGSETSRGANEERKFAAKLRLPYYRVDADNDYFARERLIGISGFARSGKDTLASLLEPLGFERVAFADRMRAILYALNPMVAGVPVQVMVNEIGWDDAKTRYSEVRQLLQRLGTEGGRKNLGENVWVDAALDRFVPEKTVITDVRFKNEAAAVRQRGGIVVRIEREGVGPVNNHPSELDVVDDYDVLIYNNGWPEEMLEQLSEHLDYISDLRG
jgi:hypothetical protein